MGRLEEAIPEYREALRLKTDFPEVDNNLGGALLEKGQFDEAIAEFRKALRRNKDMFQAHNNLGNALGAKGRLDEAVAELREALRLNNDGAEIHCNLGDALVRQGQFQEAVQELRTGRELGSRNPRWPYAARAAQQLRDAERLANLDARLPAILKGEEQAKDVGERLLLAQICQRKKKLYAAATRFFAEAIPAQPNLAGDLMAANRYNAACAAALAGCGQGADAAELDDKERARLRRQALAWLWSNLAAWRAALDKEPDKARPVALQRLQHWQEDSDFAGVRGDALGKLPAAERQAWQQFWTDVAETLARANGKTAPAKKPDSK